MSERQQPNAAAPLFCGDFYQGAYGPTIILIAESPAACAWLQDVFRRLADCGPNCMLTAVPQVRFRNVEMIEMAHRENGPRVTLERSADDVEVRFMWSATTAGWRYLADLIEPLAEGKAGHQYLTEDKDDAAAIELSCGEQDVLDALKSGSGRT